MQPLSGNNEKLEALRKREAAVKAAIAAEKVRQQKRDDKDHDRLVGIVGKCLLAGHAANPQLALLFEENLKRHANPRDFDFLRSKGWRI